jgi:hypothetical protein
VLLTALTAVVALVLPTTGASAKPAPPPPPVVITVTDLVSSVTTPITGGQPLDFVAIGAPFALAVTFTSAGVPAPISETRDVTLQVSVTGSSFASGSRTSFVVPKGHVDALLEGIVLAVPGNGVVLTVAAVAPRQETSTVVAGKTSAVDVAKDFNDVPINGAVGVTVSRDGVDTTCSLADRLTCVDLILPADGDNGDKAFFSTGVCDKVVGSCRSGDLMQVLAVFDLEPTNPATFVIKCAKSLCGNGSIQRNVVNVSVAGSGLLEPAPACTDKGVLEEGQPFCVDYVQARRDGAGVTYLPVLMPKDARFSI